jgi:exodeoxyribonuclease VII large subunit
MASAVANIPEYSIAELSRALRRTIETAFGQVRLRGEISGFKRHSSGHLYFTLKDAESCIDAVMWKGTAAGLAFRPEDGLEVVATGRLSTYPRSSRYQIIVERLEVAGAGALLAQIEERRRRLAAEGLFAAGRKRRPPFVPTHIGIVTSPTGAVIRDILHRLSDRLPRRVTLWPVPVQGEGAAPAIAAAIRGFNAMAEAERPDLLIVARGGGSVEDLMAFNAEEVVRAAAGSTIPLIAAVGHETDTTLIDHAADVRAPTPTAAAELAVPVGADLRETLADLGLRAERSERRARIRAADKFADLAARLPRPSALLGPSRQRFDDCCDRFGRGLRNLVAGDRARLAAASARLQARLLVQRVERERARAQAPRVTPNPALLAGRIRAARAALAGTMRLIESLAPQSVLERGFALVEDGRGGLVKRAAGVATGDRLVLRFADGTRPVVAAGGPRSRPPAAPDQGTLL